MGRPSRAGPDGSLRRRHHEIYFAQTWLLFPTALAGAAQAQLPASTQRFDVRTPDGESLASVQIPSIEGRAEGAATMLGFGGNAWNAEAMALTLHMLFPHRHVVAFHYRGYAPSSGRPSAQALFLDSLAIFDHLQQTQASGPISAIGFSIGSGVAAYLASPASTCCGVDLGHSFQLAGGLGSGSLLVGSCRPAPPPSYAHDRVCSWLARAHGPDHSGAKPAMSSEMSS